MASMLNMPRNHMGGKSQEQTAVSPSTGTVDGNKSDFRSMSGVLLHITVVIVVHETTFTHEHLKSAEIACQLILEVAVRCSCYSLLA